MIEKHRLVLCLALILGSGGHARAADPRIRAISADDSSGTASAVVVDGSLALVHTSQILPLDAQQKQVVAENTVRQSEVVLDRLEARLTEARSGLDRLIKLNVYARDSQAVADFRPSLAKRLAGTARPAVSFVTGALTDPDARVAVDAIAGTALKTEPGVVLRPGPGLAVLPPGARVYVSGQAEAGEDLRLSTRKTLEGLAATLKFLGLERSQVVQVKAFLQPMTAVADVEREIADFFDETAAPTRVFVEWRSGPKQPIEIELIAASRADDARPALEFLAPPGLKPSPVFSRIARVNRGDLIYVSGLYASGGLSGRDQVEDLFATLSKVLSASGSDLRHLAKATYYVSEDDASRALNDLRPKYYDPTRPPAASKAVVPGVGMEGRSITFDMIAVARSS